MGACSGECSRMISAEDDQTFPCSSGTFTHAFKLEGVEAAGGKCQLHAETSDWRRFLTCSQYVTAPSEIPVLQTNIFDRDETAPRDDETIEKLTLRSYRSECTSTPTLHVVALAVNQWVVLSRTVVSSLGWR